MALGTLNSWLLEVFQKRRETLLFESGCNHPGAANQMLLVSVPLSKALHIFGSPIPHL